jgi:hypothetical protein
MNEDKKNSLVNAREYDKMLTIEKLFSPEALLPSNLEDLASMTLDFDEEKGNQRVVETTTSDGEKIIIKYHKIEKDQFDEVLHEGFIGLFGINNLNLPNFAKILGIKLKDACIGLVDDYGEIDDDAICNYVMYQFIEGKTLLSFFQEDKLEKLDVKSGFEVLLKLYLALQTANNLIEFTHYDLHALNVIVTPKGEPVIIDYGSSHIRYGGENYGRSLKIGEIYNKSMWFHDVFKVTAFILADIDDEVDYEREINEQTNWISTWRSKILDNEKKIESNERRIYAIPDAIIKFQQKIDDYEEYKAEVEEKLKVRPDKRIKLLSLIERIEREIKIYKNSIDSANYNSKELPNENNRLRRKIKEDRDTENRLIKQLKKYKGDGAPRASEISLMLRKICSFFDSSFMNAKYIVQYGIKYEYYQPSPKIIKKNPRFDDFIKYIMQM